ncbi:hypothetical protein PYW07_011194 [Mythimna separata]|uniref:Phospholipid scramblase n=1 Tax=Mythimna separata TaxID=271217 RepID=A0AAD7Y7F2_MYTSE|nr:hypothetical protein PYW07_011194 [Mythimna separata]
MVITPTTSVVSGGPLWMQCPAIKQDHIPGLAYIYPLDQLIVAQKRDTLHDVIGPGGIAYTIFNSNGQKVFLAVLKKKFRQFNVKIFNNYGNEVINVKRPFSLSAKQVLVWAPPGKFLGSVQERRRCISTYIVKDESGKKVLKISAVGFCRNVYKVSVESCGGREVGKMHAGFPVVNVKNFGVTFPQESDVKEKAVLLGACFLIGP